MSSAVLHWSYRDLKEIPREVFDDYIEDLYLKENFIERFPMWLFEMKNLKFINVQGNLITEIPDQIQFLQNLEFLDLSKNTIRVLPVSVFNCRKLKCLNLCENSIEKVPKEVGKLLELEVLDLSRNKLVVIPNELANCSNLIELNLSGNGNLRRIPNKVFGLNKLVFINFNDCRLKYLPYIIGSGLIHARVFENTELTHIPVLFQIFIQPSWMENLPLLSYAPPTYLREEKPRNELLKVYSSTIKRWFNLPQGVYKVHNRILRNPFSLFELSLRKFYTTFWGYVMDILLSDQIPFVLLEYIRAGPIGHCSNMFCVVPLFRECYFSALHRQHSHENLIFSSIFCSKDCSDVWFKNNGAMYMEIEWN